MLNKIYNISPEWLKRLWIWSFKTLRKIFYVCFGINNSKLCINNSQFTENYREFQLQRRYGPLKHFCFAPYKSMFFSLHGKMSPCYATYNDNSDVYGEKNIKESWLSGSFNKIRDEHSSCDFNTNCSFCNQVFVNKAYGSMLMQKYEHYAFTKSRYPVIMEFELSNRCNLECIMCDSNLSSSICKRNQYDSKQETIYDDKFIDELKEFIPHLKMAEFTGGDPFLIEIYYQIWDIIIELNPYCDILITTNANTMSDRIKSLMDRSKRLHFNVSIDSATKTTYEKIRINGSFEKALSNIAIFNAYCKKNKTNLNLLVCPLTVNSRELPGLIELGNSLDAGVFFHTVVKPENLSLKFAGVNYLDELIQYLGNYSFPQNTRNQQVNSKNYQNLICLIESWRNEANHREHSLNETQRINESTSHCLFNNIIKNGSPAEVEKVEQLAAAINQQPKREQILLVLDSMQYDELMKAFVELSIAEFLTFVGKQKSSGL